MFCYINDQFDPFFETTYSWLIIFDENVDIKKIYKKIFFLFQNGEKAEHVKHLKTERIFFQLQFGSCIFG